MLKKFLEYSINENSTTKSRVLFVESHNGDYGALSFKNVHSGTKVVDIMNNPDDYKPATDDEGDWQLSVLEFDGDINDGFVEFVRDHILDYDQSKHENFYLENEEIG